MPPRRIECRRAPPATVIPTGSGRTVIDQIEAGPGRSTAAMLVGDFTQIASAACKLAPSRYDWICEIFGGHAEHVERADELRPALERALGTGGPAIVNVMLDPDAMAGHAYRGM